MLLLVKRYCLKIIVFLLFITSLFFIFQKTVYGCITWPREKKFFTYDTDPNKCSPVTCQVASGVYQAYITYQYDDRSYCTQLEYFSNSSCTVNASFNCSGSCTSDSQCGEGICAGGDADVTSVCTNLNRGTQPYYCQGYNCGYTCNTSNYTCSRVAPGVGQGSSQSYCVSSCVAPTATPTSTPTPTPVPPSPNCSISANTTNKTITVNGTNLTPNNINRYEFSFSPSGRKDTVIPPEDQTVSYSEFTETTNVSVEAYTDGLSPPGYAYCGSLNITSSGCVINTTKCSPPNTASPDCNGGNCNASGICSTCSSGTDGGNPCPVRNFTNYTASCTASGRIKAQADPSGGMGKIQFIVRDPNNPDPVTNQLCYSRGLSFDTSTSPFTKWWTSEGCGAVGTVSDITSGYRWELSNGYPTVSGTNYFDSSLVRRDYYRLQIWMGNGAPGKSCFYHVRCNNGTPSSHFAEDQTTPSACFDVVSQNYIKNVTFSCDERPTGMRILADIESNVSGNPFAILMYPDKDSGAGERQTSICNVNRDGGPSGGCSLVNTINTRNYQFNGNTKATSFTGVVGEKYKVDLSVSKDTGGCTQGASTTVTCDGYNITGKGYWDQNGNRSQDAGEPDYGQTIAIQSSGGTVSYPASGGYKLKFLNQGTYSVTLDQMTNRRITTQNPLSVSVGPSHATDQNFGITGFKTITGRVFIDDDRDGIKDAGESYYTDSANPFNISINKPYEENEAENFTDGSYRITQVTAGNLYNVSIATPNGYRVSKYSSFPNLEVGTNCTSSITLASTVGAYCDANNSIVDLNFGLSPKSIWFQGIGGDMRIDDGFKDLMTRGANPPYISLDNSNGTPGVIFTGNRAYDFCQGPETVNDTYCRSSSQKWVAGGTTYPDLYPSNKLTASYSYMKALIKQRGEPITNLNTISTCTNFNSCTLPANLPQGVYEADATTTPGRTLVLNAWTPSLTNSDYVFLINGNLGLSGNISIPQASGNTASFFVLEDIYVDSTFGVAANNSTTFNLDGIYSAGKSFKIDHDLSKSCSNQDINLREDKRLNMRGTIIVNAALQGGSLENSRDLCNSSIYPSLYIEERPDFYFNLPSYVLTKDWIWQEVAP